MALNWKAGVAGFAHGFGTSYEQTLSDNDKEARANRLAQAEMQRKQNFLQYSNEQSTIQKGKERDAARADWQSPEATAQREAERQEALGLAGDSIGVKAKATAEAKQKYGTPGKPLTASEKLKVEGLAKEEAEVAGFEPGTKEYDEFVAGWAKNKKAELTGGSAPTVDAETGAPLAAPKIKAKVRQQKEPAKATPEQEEVSLNKIIDAIAEVAGTPQEGEAWDEAAANLSEAGLARLRAMWGGTAGSLARDKMSAGGAKPSLLDKFSETMVGPR